MTEVKWEKFDVTSTDKIARFFDGLYKQGAEVVACTVVPGEGYSALVIYYRGSL